MIEKHPTNSAPAASSERLARLVGSLSRALPHAVIGLSSGDGDQFWAAGANTAASQPFFIASITKRFVAALTLQCAERGQVELDASICDYLPRELTAALHMWRGVDRTPQITVRHLATHTSGLPDNLEKQRRDPSLMSRIRRGEDVAWTLEESVHVMRKQQRPHFAPQDLSAPRQRARYSDSGYQLLIRILETCSGRTFPQLLAEGILRPLQLTHTLHPSSAAPEGLPPTARIHDGPAPRELSGLIRSSNDLYSTVEDLLRFNRALVSGELFQQPGTTSILTERRNRLGNAPVLHYGFGTMYFRLGRLATAFRPPADLVGHSGSTGTWLFHCPQLDVHLGGTIDQVRGQAQPFRIMARCLHAWRTG